MLFCCCKPTEICLLFLVIGALPAYIIWYLCEKFLFRLPDSVNDSWEIKNNDLGIN